MGWFRWFRRESKWILVYTAIGDEDCIKMVGRLADAGVVYRTKSRGIYAGREKRSLGFSTKLAQYDTYVRPEDEAKAYAAI